MSFKSLKANIGEVESTLANLNEKKVKTLALRDQIIKTPGMNSAALTRMLDYVEKGTGGVTIDDLTKMGELHSFQADENLASLDTSISRMQERLLSLKLSLPTEDDIAKVKKEAHELQASHNESVNIVRVEWAALLSALIEVFEHGITMMESWKNGTSTAQTIDQLLEENDLTIPGWTPRLTARKRVSINSAEIKLAQTIAVFIRPLLADNPSLDSHSAAQVLDYLDSMKPLLDSLTVTLPDVALSN